MRPTISKKNVTFMIRQDYGFTSIGEFFEHTKNNDDFRHNVLKRLNYSFNGLNVKSDHWITFNHYTNEYNELETVDLKGITSEKELFEELLRLHKLRMEKLKTSREHLLGSEQEKRSADLEVIKESEGTGSRGRTGILAVKPHSLQSYLASRFAETDTVTDEMVIQAKRDYWKSFYRHYRREQRKTRKEFVLGFYPEQLERINQKRGALSTSQFLYRAVELALLIEFKPMVDEQLLARVDQNLMELVNLLEEILESPAPELTREVLERIEKLELQVSQLQNNQL